MALPAGTRVGPYEIAAEIGAGGMGVVYRAHDTRLGRDVALKVLPDAFARDMERLTRFRREAHLLASLNHPNIAAIYGFEDADGVHALALELVEGPTLAERLAHGPMPLEEALPVARQIAEALEIAHERGIIHRDLKPANLKVRDDGAVKVLDFGLAKALESQAAIPGVGVSMSPTMSVHATYAGIILGTAAYMSPEQARGKPVDKRSDIWAFGCVLYEMLTGARAFDGDEVSDVLAAVLRAEPDLTKLPADTPPSITRLLKRCLEKDRRERLPDIGAARLEIKEAMEARAALPAVSSTRYPRFANIRLAWAAAIGAGVAVGVVTVMLSGRTESPVQPVARFQVFPPAGSTFIVGANGPAIAMSPDGSQVAFVASTAGKGDSLYVRRIDATEAVPLSGTEGAVNPFWSPDGRWIGFFAGTQLKKIDVSGGPPQVICANPSGALAAGVSTGTWNRDGIILFQATGNQFIHRVNANGGIPAVATRHDASRGHLGHFWPRFLPDGRHFLFWANSSAAEHRGIYLGQLDTEPTRQLVASEFAGDFAAPNHLLFRRGSTLFAQTLNLRTFELEDEPVRVADPVGALTQLGRAGFSVSDTGVLTFWPVSTPAYGQYTLTIHDRNGKVLASLEDALYRGVSLSPDGRRVAAHIEEGVGGDIWLFDLDRGSRQRFTFDASQHNASPVWSPDGKQIAFASNRSGRWGLYQKAWIGTEREELLFESSTAKGPSGYSPDGRSLLFTDLGPERLADMWILPLDADRKPVPYLQSRFRESKGAISPDGRWVAYDSDESGRVEVYVQSLSDAAGKWQVSTEGGFEPRWRSDGRELFFLGNNPGRILAADVERSGDGLQFSVPRELFQFAERNPGHVTPHLRYDVFPDGQRILVVNAPVETDSGTVPLTVVLNWPAALRQ